MKLLMLLVRVEKVLLGRSMLLIGILIDEVEVGEGDLGLDGEDERIMKMVKIIIRLTKAKKENNDSDVVAENTGDQPKKNNNRRRGRGRRGRGRGRGRRGASGAAASGDQEA